MSVSSVSAANRPQPTNVQPKRAAPSKDGKDFASALSSAQAAAQPAPQASAAPTPTPLPSKESA